ncbi:acyl carrier protein [Proteinivorax tanatarense]|uniref:acyl carrier protein n=1 Tax=Proteinivorax tanatarense TaxID=1260629 RepID=UPI003D9C74C3
MLGNNGKGVRFVELFDKVKGIIASTIGTSEEDIKPETRFQEDLELDSLDIMDLLMVLEEEFDLQIPDEQLQTMNTVGDIVNFIEENS